MQTERAVLPRPASSVQEPTSALYDRALVTWRRGRGQHLRATWDGWPVDVSLDRWCSPCGGADEAALRPLFALLPAGATVLDLGCGPGRHAAWLAARGVHVLGVDSSAVAVDMARTDRVAAQRRDALAPLPGSWDAVLLLDGNIGLRGDPLLLLCRVRDLLELGGSCLVELDEDEVTGRGRLVLHDGERASAPTPWGRLGVRELPAVARCADFTVLRRWGAGSRTFALLEAGCA